VLRVVHILVDVTVVANQTPVCQCRKWTTMSAVRRPSKSAFGGHRYDEVVDAAEFTFGSRR